MCFIQLQSERDMEMLFHYLDGYMFHEIGFPLKVEWGWFTFTNTYRPQPSTCYVCTTTFKQFVGRIENRLLQTAIENRIASLQRRNQQQRLILQQQQSPQGASNNTRHECRRQSVAERLSNTTTRSLSQPTPTTRSNLQPGVNLLPPEVRHPPAPVNLQYDYEASDPLPDLISR